MKQYLSGFLIGLLIFVPLLSAATLINWSRVSGSTPSVLACFNSVSATAYCTVDSTTLSLTNNILSAKAQAPSVPLTGKTTVSVATTSLPMPAGCITPKLLDVYVDGVLLSLTDDYTIANGSGTAPGTVTFVSAVGTGGFTDIVQMRCW